jgi:hypothetical protein
MIEDQGKFIDPEYLPDGLLLASNNHKLQKPVVDAILKHWTTRDAEGDIPFRFKIPDKADRSRKRAYTTPNVQSDQSTNEPEGGSQNGGEVNRQAQSGSALPGGSAGDEVPSGEEDAIRINVSRLPKHK